MQPRLVLLAALAAASLYALAAETISKLPPEWVLTGKTAELYEIGLDSGVTVSGRGSKFIRSTSDAAQWGTLMQTFSAKNYSGQRLRFQAKVKTSDVKGAGLWMRVDDSEQRVLGFYNSMDKPIAGTKDWQLRSVVLDVPATAANIYIGVLQYGKGQVWIDALGVEAVGKDVAVDSPVSGKPVAADKPSL